MELNSRFYIGASFFRSIYLAPIEIKAGRTVSQGYFKQFVYWKELGSLVKKLVMPIED
jgi:hypothetical protein